MISGTRFNLTAEINRQVRLGRDIARLQTEISTGKRIQDPSDDPTGSALVSQLARTQAEEATWKRNLVTASTLADRADDALASAANGLDRANELLIKASSDTLSDADRATIAQELRAIADEMSAIADTRDPRGEPLFRTGAVLEIPVYAGGTVAPVASRDEVFDNIDTAGGPLDLVTIINNAADAIVEPDKATRRTNITSGLAALEAATSHIAAARADQGVRANRIERLTETLEQSAVSLKEQRSAIEETDITEAVVRLQAKQLSLQAAQAVLARVNETTLFDVLR